MGLTILALVPLAVCTVEPPGGALVVKGRRYPAVEAGRSGAIVVHQTKKQSRSVYDPPAKRGAHWGDMSGGADGPNCEWADGAVALAFPLASAKPKVLVKPD